MKKKTKVILITAFLLLSLATISSASAATYNITDESYNDYFNDFGYISNADIVEGDTLDCSGAINNKDMRINLPLSITSTSKTGKIKNGTITILPSGSGTNVTNLVFNNTNHNGDLPGTVVLYGASNCIIANNTIFTNQTGVESNSYGIHLVEASNNRITGNNITTIGDGSGTATSVPVGGYVDPGNNHFTYGVYLDGCSNNVFDSNNIHTTGNAATVDWSDMYSGGIYSLIGFYISYGSNNNTLTNNNITTDYNQIHGDYDTILGVGIHRGSSDNKLSGNTINTTGYSYAYGLEIGGGPDDISFGNIISNNTIYSTEIREDETESYANGVKVTAYATNTQVSGNNIRAVAYRYSYPVYLEDFGYEAQITLGPSTVTGNTVYGAAQIIYLFQLFYARNQTITHNTITGEGNYCMGIGIYGSSNNIITHNTINITGDTSIPIGHNVDAIPASNEGIKIIHQSHNNIINSNYITSPDDTYAVNLNDPQYQSTGNKVTNNYLYSDNGNKLGNNAVSQGTGNTITDNYGGPPVADFTATPTTGTAPLQVNFTDTNSNHPTTWSWDFDNDGTVDSTDQNPTWTYTTPGTYIVKLTVTGYGGSDSKTFNITVVQPDSIAPVAQADVKGGLYNTTKKITLTATDNQDPNPKIYYTTDGTNPTTSSTLYTGSISISKTTTLKFIAVDGNGNVSPVKSETYTLDTVKPTITSIDPKNGATKVSQSKTIKVTFNEAIKKGNNFWIELKNNAGKSISFTTAITGKVLTIKPINNLSESLYTLIIHTGAVNDLAGNLVALKTTTFGVGTSPWVSKFDPTNGATKVATSKTIKVTFNEAIKKGSNFRIELKNNAGKSIPFTTAITGKALTIKPKSKLAESKYTLTIHSGAVTDLAGNPVALKTTKFSVGTSPIITKTDPKNDATKVTSNKAIKVTFNENIKKGSKFWVELLNSSKKAVSFTSSVSGKVLTIKSKSKLVESKYKLILHAGAVTDIAGNPVTLKTITFTTGTPPKVTKSDPKNNAKNIAPNKAIKVTFNEAIKAGKNYKIELKDNKGKKITIKKSIKGKVLTITHTKTLKANTKYKLVLHTGAVTDTAGNPITLKTISFTTRKT